jgi:hypothetical protein
MTGAFRVETSKDPDRERTIICRYNPTEVGQYMLHVKWSDAHVPGSPFPVTIVDTIEELENLRGRPSQAFEGFIDGGLRRDDDVIYERTGFRVGGGGGGGGSVFSGYGGGGRSRFANDGMSTLNGDGVVFDDDN